MGIMDGLEFEHALVDALAAYIERMGLSHFPVATAAWPEAKNAGREWQRMRTDKGKRQRLTVGDAYSLCRHLGISLASVCGAVEMNGPSTVIHKTDDDAASPVEDSSKKDAA